MSERYILNTKCAWCYKYNGEMLFNEEWASRYICKHCRQHNELRISIKSYKILKGGRKK